MSGGKGGALREQITNFEFDSAPGPGPARANFAVSALPTSRSPGGRGGRRDPLLPREQRDELLRRGARGEDDVSLSLAFGIAAHQVAKLRYNNAVKIRKLRQIEAGPAAPVEEGDEPPPIECAFAVLAERVERLRGGFFRLDGRPAGLKHIMAVANEVRLERGEPAIPYPGIVTPPPSERE